MHPVVIGACAAAAWWLWSRKRWSSRLQEHANFRGVLFVVMGALILILSATKHDLNAVSIVIGAVLLVGGLLMLLSEFRSG